MREDLTKIDVTISAVNIHHHHGDGGVGIQVLDLVSKLTEAVIVLMQMVERTEIKMTKISDAVTNVLNAVTAIKSKDDAIMTYVQSIPDLFRAAIADAVANSQGDVNVMADQLNAAADQIAADPDRILAAIQANTAPADTGGGDTTSGGGDDTTGAGGGSDTVDAGGGADTVDAGAGGDTTGGDATGAGGGEDTTGGGAGGDSLTTDTSQG